MRDLERFLRKNRAKNENCFLAVIFFQSKKFVSIWYQDLRSGYAHVKFQPDCSESVDSTAIGGFWTFAALAILYPHRSPSNFVCSNAWAPRSF